jgi:hypothetical protein
MERWDWLSGAGTLLITNHTQEQQVKTLSVILFVVSAALPAAAQTNHYVSTTGLVSLTGAATAATIQQPAANARQVTLEWATIYCSVACPVTQSQNCTTAATATAETPVGIAGNTPAPSTATFWTASNASGCTTLTTEYIPAGATFTFDLSKIRLVTSGTASNYTITIGAITGNAKITIAHGEPQ